MERSSGAYLVCEVIEQRHVTPTFHISPLVCIKLLELGLFRILIQRTEEVFMDDEVGVPLLVMNFDVVKVRVHAKGEVRW